MHFEFLQSLVIIFGISALVVYFLHKINIPSIVGFLVSGILIGPHTLGLIKEVREIEIFAEVGVILLLFTLGMEFSLKKLLRMKRIVFGSGLIQVFSTILLTFLLSYLLLKLPFEKSVFWGFLICLSSTAIVVKSIADNNETATPHGRAMIGIVLFQDLSVVLFIILVPLMGGNINFSFSEISLLILKTVAVIVFVVAGSRWFVPYLFNEIVKTKSRELFIISIFLFCIGTALFTNLMGLSLSLGAFLAGMMLSESDYAYQAMSDVVPFKESFMGMFFVSVGMLLNVRIAGEKIIPILLLFILIIVLKSLLGYISVLFAGFSSRTSIIAGIGIAQIGEFSFVLAIAGRSNGLIDENLYQIFIATSILTMLATPFLSKSAVPLASWALKTLTPTHYKTHNLRHYQRNSAKDVEHDHVIIAGYSFNGRNLAGVLKQVGIPYIIIDMDMNLVKENKALGEPIYYGDATSPDVLTHLGIKTAKMLVCTVSEPIAQRIIISNARNLNKCLYILVRTRHVKSVEDLKKAGANDVIPEEFETSMEIFHRVFLYYNVSPEIIDNTLEEIRQNNYSLLRGSSEDRISLLGKLQCIPEVDIRSVRISGRSTYTGKTIRDLNIRQVTGVTVLAIRRNGELITTPNLDVPLRENDILLFTGDPKSIGKAMDFFGD